MVFSGFISIKFYNIDKRFSRKRLKRGIYLPLRKNK